MPSHHNKQVVEAPEGPFELTPERLKEWYLHKYEKVRQHLKQARDSMIERGVSERLAKDCTYYESDPLEARFIDILGVVVNKKTGKFWDIPTLIQLGRLTDADADRIREDNEGREPPYMY